MLLWAVTSSRPILYMVDHGRYKVRKEPSPAKRCEKSGKYAKRAENMRKEPCFMDEKETLLYQVYRTKFRSI